MNNEKLNVERCGEPLAEGLAVHCWRGIPLVEETELGVISWWCCERCPARTLHDVDADDGFAAEPVVVYPPSCFPDAPCALERCFIHDGETCAAGHMIRNDCPIGARCGCPSKASGDVVHLDGCAEHEAALESAAPIRASGSAEDVYQRTQTAALDQVMAGAEGPYTVRRLEDGRVSFTRAHEPASIVHPPTDPAPPSEELRQAIEDAEEDIPTQRYPAVHVESGASLYDRIESLFGRPFKLGEGTV